MRTRTYEKVRAVLFLLFFLTANLIYSLFGTKLTFFEIGVYILIPFATYLLGLLLTILIDNIYYKIIKNKMNAKQNDLYDKAIRELTPDKDGLSWSVRKYEGKSNYYKIKQDELIDELNRNIEYSEQRIVEIQKEIDYCKEVIRGIEGREDDNTTSN